jgi:tetratricopeptide (TPR) repeat protein
MCCILLPLLALQLPVPDDSTALRRAMSAAQAGFERIRRQHLPWVIMAERCDVRIGRYCYWYDEREPPPPPEPAVLRAARNRLLERFAAAAERHPGDGWIAAQRVRYLVEQGSPREALAAARACRAEAWWCAALEGFALHTAQEYAQAEEVYARAIRHMPDSVRCRWNDLEPLLEQGEASRYRRLSCAERDSANQLLLWDARPLLATRNNDLATEMLARHTLAAALSGAVTHHGSRMDRDLAEVIVRYGWPTAWSRRSEPTALGEEIRVIGHEPRPAIAVFAWDGREASWPPTAPLARARYAPRYAKAFVALEAVQWARFARGDSAVLVVGFAVPPDTLFTGPITATLTAQTSRTAIRTEVPVVGARGAVSLSAPGDWTVAAVELFAAEQVAWASNRLRAGHIGSWPPPISDLLLTDGDSAEATSLGEAAARALPGVILPAGGDSRIGLYWEWYAWRATDQMATIRLEVIPDRPGLLERIGRAVAWSRRRPPIRLSWQRLLPAGTDPVPTGLLLNLDRLRPGRYTVLVEMTSGMGRWETGRAITLRT